MKYKVMSMMSLFLIGCGGAANDDNATHPETDEVFVSQEQRLPVEEGKSQSNPLPPERDRRVQEGGGQQLEPARPEVSEDRVTLPVSEHSEVKAIIRDGKASIIVPSDELRSDLQIMIFHTPVAQSNVSQIQESCQDYQVPVIYGFHQMSFRFLAQPLLTDRIRLNLERQGYQGVDILSPFSPEEVTVKLVDYEGGQQERLISMEHIMAPMILGQHVVWSGEAGYLQFNDRSGEMIKNVCRIVNGQSYLLIELTDNEGHTVNIRFDQVRKVST